MDESKGGREMKEQDKFDTWLHNSLDGYSPVPARSSRERFLTEAVSAAKVGGSNTFLMIGITLMVVISALCVYELSSKEPSALKYYPAIADLDKNVVHVAGVVESSALEGDLSNRKSENDKLGEASAYLNENPDKTNIRAGFLNNKGNPGLESNDRVEELSKERSASLTEQSLISGEAKVDDGPGFDKISDLQLKDNVVVRITDSLSNQIDKTEGEPAKDLNIVDKNQKPGEFDPYKNRFIFMYYRPEYLWNIIEDEKLVHNFGLEWQTKLFNGRYTLGTGIGLSLNKGYYEYAVDYNEYLGIYQQLDSVTFNWDPQEFDMRYEVHTTEAMVYDTTVKTSYERVYRKFVYLQLPLTLGYDFVKTGRSTLGFRFVPIISILLSKKPVDFRYDAGNNRIIQINRITADRVNSNWQLNSGLVYGRQLNESLKLEIEPRFTYYFNSVFEKSDNSVSPMGASIRVALGIRY